MQQLAVKLLEIEFFTLQGGSQQEPLLLPQVSGPKACREVAL